MLEKAPLAPGDVPSGMSGIGGQRRGKTEIHPLEKEKGV